MDKVEIRSVGEHRYGRNRERVQYFLRIPASITEGTPYSQYSLMYVGFRQIGEKTWELVPNPKEGRMYKVYAEFLRTREDWEGKKKTTKVVGNYRMTIPRKIAEISGIYGKSGNYAIVTRINERFFVILLTMEDIANIFLGDEPDALAIRRVNVNRYVRLSEKLTEEEMEELRAIGKKLKKKSKVVYVRRDEEDKYFFQKQYWIYVPEEIVKLVGLAGEKVDFVPVDEKRKVYEIRRAWIVGHVVENYWLSMDDSNTERKNFRLTLPKNMCDMLEVKEGELKYTILYVKDGRLLVRLITEKDLWDLVDEMI